MNKKKVIKSVEKYIADNPPKSRSPKRIYLKHVLGVREYAVKLAKIYKANLFVVELSALLHDAAGDAGKRHDKEGAKLSKIVLEKLGVPKEIREKVSQCIRTHSTGSKAKDLEGQILQDADGITFLKKNYKDFFRLFKDTGPLEEVRKMCVKKTERMMKKIRTEAGVKLAKKFFPEAMNYSKNAR